MKKIAEGGALVLQLDANGSVAKQITLGIAQSVGQVLGNAGGLVAAYLEGTGQLKPEEWRVHITAMTFDVDAQTLQVTGLELRQVK